MFDVIGKRRLFYLFSLLITIPGIIAILAGPLTDGKAGLQLSIDYTGGTVWEVQFEGQAPSTADVKEVLTQQGLPDSVVAITGTGDTQRVLIRTEQIGLSPDPTPSPAPPSPSASASSSTSPDASPSASSSAGTSASPGASASSGASASPSASPSGSPSPSSSASAAASPGTSQSTAAGCSPVPTTGKLAELATALQARFSRITCVTQESSIGPTVSEELTGQALVLIVLGSLGIMGWITLRFRDFRMGAVAIGALIHDVVVVVGTFAILGTFFGVQIDGLFVTAMLTVIGFSVHDTIVVFDRIRENRIRHAGEPFAGIVNHSILQTIGRSINTSLTVVITLTALLLFGGEAIRVFVLALLLGILSGTYSSIFNASPILVDWHLRADRRREQQLSAARATR